MSKRRRHFPPGFGGDAISRRSAGQNPSKSILIVTEGRNTEPGYFRALAALWNVHPKLIQLAPGGEGIPGKLVKRALEETAKLAKKAKRDQLAYNELGSFDEVWIVFDTEHAQRQGKLDEGMAAAREARFEVAHSTPCFEFWLALHYSNSAPPMNTCDEASRLLERVAALPSVSYSKKRGASEDFLKGVVPKVGTAFRHAQVMTRNQAGEPFPANPSTAVQRLVASIHETLPDAMKERYPIA
jgi:hypothetical protein